MDRPETARKRRYSAPHLGVPEWHGSDEELFATLSQSPGPQAMGYLYDRFSADVNRLVWRLLGADDQHDDLVQQVFCKLLTGTRQLKKVRTLKSWVMTITVNTVRSDLRKRTVRRRYAGGEVDPDQHSGTSTDLEARALLARTFAVLEKLKPDLRIAFVLRYVDAMSLEDTAAACDCSLATIKRRLVRAQRRFTKLAEKDTALSQRLQLGRWGQA